MHKDVEDILGQFYCSFGQGAGTMRIRRSAIAALRERYFDPIQDNLDSWKEMAPSVLGSWPRSGVRPLSLRPRTVERQSTRVISCAPDGSSNTASTRRATDRERFTSARSVRVLKVSMPPSRSPRHRRSTNRSTPHESLRRRPIEIGTLVGSGIKAGSVPG